jgi:hypothetical protein
VISCDFYFKLRQIIELETSIYNIIAISNKNFIYEIIVVNTTAKHVNEHQYLKSGEMRYSSIPLILRKTLNHLNALN